MLLLFGMRKHWGLVIFGLLVIGIATVALSPKPDDKFAILRKFHPTETVGQPDNPFPFPVKELWDRKFTFKEITPELWSVLGIPYEQDPGVSFYSFEFEGLRAHIDLDSMEVMFDPRPPSWFELQMQTLKRRLGW